MRKQLFAVLVMAACATAENQADSAAMPRGDSPATGTPSGQADSVRTSDSLRVTTDKQTYRPGETVTLTIVSTSTSQFTYNPCTRTVERDSAGTWTPVREQRICTMIAHLLEPKQTRIEQTEMAEGIEPGNYRLVIAFSEESPAGTSRSVRAATSTLTVVR